jgi:hypothetical protein
MALKATIAQRPPTHGAVDLADLTVAEVEEALLNPEDVRLRLPADQIAGCFGRSWFSLRVEGMPRPWGAGSWQSKS